jgi:hypothetical protein
MVGSDGVTGCTSSVWHVRCFLVLLSSYVVLYVHISRSSHPQLILRLFLRFILCLLSWCVCVCVCVFRCVCVCVCFMYVCFMSLSLSPPPPSLVFSTACLRWSCDTPLVTRRECTHCSGRVPDPHVPESVRRPWTAPCSTLWHNVRPLTRSARRSRRTRRPPSGGCEGV